MSIPETPLSDDQDREFTRHYAPRPNPLPIPDVGIFDAPLVCLRINAEWASHFRGVIDALDQIDAWLGTDEEILAARRQVREALFSFVEDCMVDPCCPEAIDAANLANIIQIQNLYNQYFSANAEQAEQNQGLYDGTPESIYFHAGANFDSASAGVLCDAVDNFLGQMIAFVGSRTALALALIGTSTAAAIAALGAMAVFGPGGVIVAGVVMGVSLAIALADVEEAWNNPTAQRKVRCCMFEALTGQALTQEIFTTALDGCGFDAESPEERIRVGLAPLLTEEANWLAFLRCLNIASGTSTESCECDCDTADIVLVALSPETVVTQLTATTWQVTSSWLPGDDPARPTARVAKVADQFFRCINFVTSSQGMVDGTRRDCDNVDQFSLGFPAGNGIIVNFRQDADDIDTVLTIACP